MNKLKKTIIVFCFISILLILDDLIAKIYADSNDPTRDCNNNIFTGDWKFLNAYDYLLARSISSLSPGFMVIYLLHKSKVNPQ